MGREAECMCQCNNQKALVKALIEPPELILRGDIRRRIPFSQLEHLRADEHGLRFVFQGESYALAFGTKLASKWAEALRTPPPSLAKKLGISNDTVVRIVGAIDDDALQQALSSAKAISSEHAGLIVARVDTLDALGHALRASAHQLDDRVPIWLIYPKGRGHALSENDVRSTCLAAGIVDTKVASVSSTLTGVRFVKRRDA